jgi:hypothetical protein
MGAIRIAAVCVLLVGCKDDNNNNGKKDLSVAADLSVTSVDSGGGCTTQGGACTEANGRHGICMGGVCSDCGTDDAACLTAYGTAGNPYFCGGGQCIPGCRMTADCGGKICGLATANVCGACTTDAQCQMAFGSGRICNASSGLCVSSACTTVSTPCSANSADVCCASGGSNACVTGTCCTNSECGDGGKSCVNHVCTNCPAITGNTYYVDPSETAGGVPTGANVAGCRFKTITAAMNAATGPATIKVLGTAPITGSGACTDPTIECFPIAVKAGIAVVGDSTMPPTIKVTASQTGFTMSAVSSSLSTLTLDGLDGASKAIVGVSVPNVAPSPTPTPAPTLDHVTLKNFSIAAIDVNGDTVNINQGTAAEGNFRGLRVQGFGKAVVALVNGGGTDGISFSKNTSTGVVIN